MCDRFISLSCEMLMWLVIISGCKVWDLRQDHGMFSLFKMAKVCPHPPRDYLPISPLSLSLSLLIYFTTFLFHHSLYNSSLLVSFFFFFTPPLDPFFFRSLYYCYFLQWSTVGISGAEKLFQVWGKKFQTLNLIPVESLISASTN